jgi:hypothetical protein
MARGQHEENQSDVCGAPEPAGGSTPRPRALGVAASTLDGTYPRKLDTTKFPKSTAGSIGSMCCT